MTIFLWLFLLFPHVYDIGFAVYAWLFLGLPTTSSHSEILEMTPHKEIYKNVESTGNAPGRYTPVNDSLDFGNWDFWFIYDNGMLIFTVLGLAWYIYYMVAMIVTSVDDD